MARVHVFGKYIHEPAVETIHRVLDSYCLPPALRVGDGVGQHPKG